MKHRSVSGLRSEVGFTFVEVLAALLFLGILMPVVIGALQVANRAAVVSERSAVAVQLGENELAELQLGDAWSSAETRGEFGAEWPGYRWELTKADWESGAMTELQLAVFFNVQGREHDVRLSTLVSESLTQTQ
jgi:type II secretory pathway pseudopilin PulG